MPGIADRMRSQGAPLQAHSLETLIAQQNPPGCMKGCFALFLLFWIAFAVFMLFFYDRNPPPKDVQIEETANWSWPVDPNAEPDTSEPDTGE